MNPVLMLCYNTTKEQFEWTKRSIDSILKQDIPIELTVIDNGSTWPETKPWLQECGAHTVWNYPTNTSPLAHANRYCETTFSLGKIHALGIPDDATFPPNLYSELLRFKHGFVSAAMACDRVELTTNLIPLTPQKAEEIVHSGIHYIRVSWYGTMENRVLKNLRALKELRWQHSQKQPFITVKYHSEEQRVFLLGNRAVCDEIVGEQLHTIASDFVHLRSYEENKKACPYPFYTMVVKSNGDVVPCCVAWDKSLVVGNVNDHSLAELWNSPRMEEIRKTHLRGERSSLSACASCDTIFNCPDSVDSVSASEYESRRYNEKEGNCGSD